MGRAGTMDLSWRPSLPAVSGSSTCH